MGLKSKVGGLEAEVMGLRLEADSRQVLSFVEVGGPTFKAGISQVRKKLLLFMK